MTNGATASVVNEADSRIYYKTFDGKFIPYLIEGEGGGDYEITYYNATATTTFSFTESAHYFPNATSDETDCVFTFTIEDGAITNGGFSFVLKATGTNSNTFTLTDETSKGINWASDIPAELEYGKWYILAVENFTGIFCELK